MSATVHGLANIPWEPRPANSLDVVWRYSANPVIARNLIPASNSIFNSAVVPHAGEFAGVFRCDNKRRQMNLHAGRIAIYYGGADTVTALAFTTLPAVLDFLQHNSSQ